MEHFYLHMDNYLRGVPAEYSRNVKKEVVDRISGIYYKDQEETEVMRSILDYFLSSFPERTEELHEMETLWLKSSEST